jgi:hypothetical protein
MANKPWLDDVRQRLARQSLPPGYVERFMEELADHFHDLTEENMEADAISRLGEPEQVAEAAVTAYRRRGVFGRHPTAAFLVFAISPVMSLVVLSGLMTVGLWIIAALAERFGLLDGEGSGYATQPASITLAATAFLFSLLLVVIPAVLASFLYCKLAKRVEMGRKWVFVSCAVLAVTAMLPCWDVRAKLISATGNYAVCIGVWIPGLCGWSFPVGMMQLVQLLVPLAIGLWFLRHKHDQGQLRLAS